MAKKTETQETIVSEQEAHQPATNAPPPDNRVEAIADASVSEPDHSGPGANTRHRFSHLLPGRWEDWADARRSAGRDSQTAFEQSRKKLKQAVSMLAIEIVHRDGHDWDQEASDLVIEVPASAHEHMAATAATFGGSTNDDDEKAKKARSAFLDRTALAVEWLVDKVTTTPDLYPANDAGRDALIKVIDDEGGLAELAKKQRKLNAEKKVPSAKRPRVIELDADAVRRVRIDRATRQLMEAAPSSNAKVRLGIVFEDGPAVSVVTTLSANDKQIEQAKLDMGVMDPLTDQLGELLHAGEMVAEMETTIAKDRDDDPEDPESGFRIAHRHFVFRDDGPTVISPILASSSVIVLATPKSPIFDRTLGGPCHLRTRERRIMEENIVPITSRAAFSTRIESADQTDGVCRFVTMTDAAISTDDIGRNVGALVEPLRSTPGNLPLAIELSRFRPRIEGHISLRVWRSRHGDYVATVTKPRGTAGKDRQRHKLSADGWKIASSKKDDERDFGSDGSETEVEVMAGDFYRVSKAVADLPVVGDIQVKADRTAGLLIGFETRQFEYQVYIPAMTTGGDRTAMLVVPFDVSASA